MTKIEKQAETKPAAPGQSDAPVTMAQVQGLLDAQRREHERVVAALVDRLSASPGMNQDAIAALNEKMLQSVNVHEYINAQNRKTEEWLGSDAGQHTKRMWQRLLTGQYGFLIVLESGPNELNSGRSKADAFSSRAVFADGHTAEEAAHLAFGKYWQELGCSRPPQFFQQVALPREEAEQIRAELLAMAESVGMDDDALRRKCIKYIHRHRAAKLARQAAQQDRTEEAAPDTLPDRFQYAPEGHYPGVNTAYPTLDSADPGVVMVDGSADLRELIPAL